MITCKKFLRLLSFFVVFCPASLFALEFKTVDFERLLRAHPLMKHFDPDSGRFKGTISEIIPVEVMQQRVASLTAQIAARETAKSELARQALNSTIVDEAAIWNSIREHDTAIASLKKQLAAEQELLDQKGVPALTTLFSQTTTLVRDVVRGAAASGSLLINKLPRFRSGLPRPGENDLRRFFFYLDAPRLEKYLQNSGTIGLMFSQTDRPVLFERNGED
ncbi:MAG TPA: hypothetical protein PLM07_07375 [Candidatus Rifleibacterium sp.]|nr:hypothetical protein [Candidatus Rifleibacterium sp.]HPT45705.1 hypothetical protein [Candidatus Rifleibacterium sp.]